MNSKVHPSYLRFFCFNKSKGTIPGFCFKTLPCLNHCQNPVITVQGSRKEIDLLVISNEGIAAPPPSQFSFVHACLFLTNSYFNKFIKCIALLLSSAVWLPVTNACSRCPSSVSWAAAAASFPTSHLFFHRAHQSAPTQQTPGSPHPEIEPRQDCPVEGEAVVAYQRWWRKWRWESTSPPHHTSSLFQCCSNASPQSSCGPNNTACRTASRRWWIHRPWLQYLVPISNDFTCFASASTMDGFFFNSKPRVDECGKSSSLPPQAVREPDPFSSSVRSSSASAAIPSNCASLLWARGPKGSIWFASTGMSVHRNQLQLDNWNCWSARMSDLCPY